MKQFNIQPIEKLRKHDGEFLDVHSIFYTIQGEGPFTGRPAVFVRLAGCNLQCPLCDTQYTSGRKEMLYLDVYNEVWVRIEEADAQTLPIVVITGGEPFRQNLGPLLRKLTKHFTVQIETNGTLPPTVQDGFTYSPDGVTANAVHVVCSPKTGKINEKLREVAMCYKYVASAVDIADDGLPDVALMHSAVPRLARPQGAKPVYLQPADEKDDAVNAANVKAVTAACLQHGYTLQLQVHKYIGVE